MADYDLKSISPDTDGPLNDSSVLFGADDQSSATPKPYTWGGLKAWIKSWIVKADVGLGNVANADTTTQVNVVFTGLSAAAAVADADTFPTNQGAANLKQTFTSIKAWIRSWVYPNGYVSGNWHLGALLGTTSVAGVAMSVTVQYMVPFQVFQTITVSDLGIRSTTAGTSNIQLGLYANGTGATANRPAGLLSNTGSFVNNGTAGFYSAPLGANQQLIPGLYWLAVQCNDTTCILLSGANTGTSFEILMGSATGAGAIGGAAAQTNGVTIPSTFGTWATAVGATFTEQTNTRDPFVAFKIASIP